MALIERPFEEQGISVVWDDETAEERRSCAYPPQLTSRQNILLPLAGNSAASHDPDNNPRLVSVYAQARDIINAAGGIREQLVQTSEENVRVIRTGAFNLATGLAWRGYR